jgi:hypothetical protein
MTVLSRTSTLLACHFVAISANVGAEGHQPTARRLERPEMGTRRAASSPRIQFRRTTASRFVAKLPPYSSTDSRPPVGSALDIAFCRFSLPSL